MTNGFPADWGFVIYFLLSALSGLVVFAWLEHIAGQPKALALLALIPAVGVLIFFVVVITRRRRVTRKAMSERWASSEEKA